MPVEDIASLIEQVSYVEIARDSETVCPQRHRLPGRQLRTKGRASANYRQPSAVREVVQQRLGEYL